MKTKLIQFTGGLRWNESMMPDRILTPGEPDYAGFPTPEIDAAWRNLTERQYIVVKFNYMVRATNMYM